MDKKNFNITWLKDKAEMPAAETPCPRCSDGFLYKSKYYDGVYCNVCKWSWRMSKFSEEDAPKEPKWAPKIEKAETDTIFGKLADIELKVDFIITKIKEKEEENQ